MAEKKYINILLILTFFIALILSLRSVILDTDFVFSDAVARVGTQEISRDRYNEILNLVDENNVNEISSNKKALIRERLIDEELLLQKAIELGLIRKDSILKNNIVQVMLDYIVSSNQEPDPTNQELNEFFEKNLGLFSGTTSFKLKVFSFVRDTTKAEIAYQSLKKGSLKQAESSSEELIILPQTFLSLQKIRDYLGPSILPTIKNLKKGEFTEIIEINNMSVIILCLDTLIESVPKFQNIKNQVKGRYIKERDDRLVREYLKELREMNEVEKFAL
tara:strand:- start:418 stop:1248 length:831 start_codon:yes stop_codon:yes gene_type:complete